MPDQRYRRTLILFGALAVYIVLQSCWWAWLLVEKDRELEQLIDAFQLRTTTSISGGHAERTLWMVLGEGLVFLALLLLALVMVFRAVRRELSLARQQQNFLLSVSHELRTPIAGLKLHLQTLARPELDAQSRADLHGRALGDVERLGALTEKILLATRLEEADVPLSIAPHALGPLVERIAEHARSTYARGHPIHVHADHLVVRIDPAAFTSVLENMLDNAAKYSPAGASIDVELRRAGDQAVMRICDRGPGIAPEDRSRIFEKFHRGGDEERRRTRGTGLGLYIAERLMRRMRGTLSVSERPGGGSIFAASFSMH